VPTNLGTAELVRIAAAMCVGAVLGASSLTTLYVSLAPSDARPTSVFELRPASAPQPSDPNVAAGEPSTTVDGGGASDGTKGGEPNVAVREDAPVSTGGHTTDRSARPAHVDRAPAAATGSRDQAGADRKPDRRVATPPIAPEQVVAARVGSGEANKAPTGSARFSDAEAGRAPAARDKPAEAGSAPSGPARAELQARGAQAPAIAAGRRAPEAAAPPRANPPQAPGPKKPAPRGDKQAKPAKPTNAAANIPAGATNGGGVARPTKPKPAANPTPKPPSAKPKPPKPASARGVTSGGTVRKAPKPRTALPAAPPPAGLPVPPPPQAAPS
jgi:hypothetical protein